MRIVNKSVLFIIIAIVIACASNIQWGKDNWKNIVKADGKGYYAYLPAVFIYNDLHFSFFDTIEKKYPNPQIYYEYRVGKEDKRSNKYFAGTSLAIMPFFLVAHCIAQITGSDADGYSKIYLIMVNIAAIFYLFIGLYYLRKILRRYETPESLVSFILIAVTFGTNVFYYAVCEPAMSHIYSFAFIALFVYYLNLLYAFPTVRSYIVVSVLFGIIILIRPVNGLIILIAPFISGDYKKFMNGLVYLKAHRFALLSGIIIAFSIVSIQLIIYKIQTGNFWINSYGDEKFNWSHPHPIDFLFSYKKGLFVYTPLAFISLLGLCQLYKQGKFQFYTLIIFLIIMLYVLSAWWSWWYGGSFSSRVSIEYYIVLALLISYSYRFLKSKIGRNVYSFLIIGLLLVCQIQTYQYRYYNIHWEKMDKEHYWRVFLRLDQLKENPNADLLK
jgi:hypothetical protein